MLNIKPVTDIRDAWLVAKIRNSGRKYMTGDKTELKYDAQMDWYKDTYLTANKLNEMFLFIGYEDTTPTAMGFISLRDKNYWITGIIAPEGQGKGYGKQLFKFLTEYTLTLSSTVMLDVLKTNDRAIGLYHKLGYTDVERDNKRIVMCLNRSDYEA